MFTRSTIRGRDPSGSHEPLPLAGRLFNRGCDYSGLLKSASTMARAEGLELALVGGAVRDLFLGLPVKDIDLLVEGELEAIRRFSSLLREAIGARLLEHDRFGTFSFSLSDGRRMDLARARQEIYPRPAALPEVRPASLVQDLSRRDFTINSIALRLEPGVFEDVAEDLGEQSGSEASGTRGVLRAEAILDPCGGSADLEAGLIRVLHPRSFVDDPTRIFRAIRFEARLAFHMTSETEAWAREALKHGSVEQLSVTRLAAEIQGLLCEPSYLASIRRMDELGMMSHLGLHPLSPAMEFGLERMTEALTMLGRAEGLEPFSRPLPDLAQARMMVLLTAVPESEREVAAERLCMRGGVASRIRRACEVHRSLLSALDEEGSWAPSRLVKELEPFEAETWALAWAMSESSRQRGRLEAYLSHHRLVKSPLDGRELVAAGLLPGPIYGVILESLRKMALDSGLGREAALAWLKEEGTAVLERKVRGRSSGNRGSEISDDGGRGVRTEGERSMEK